MTKHDHNLEVCLSYKYLITYLSNPVVPLSMTIFYTKRAGQTSPGQLLHLEALQQTSISFGAKPKQVS